MRFPHSPSLKSSLTGERSCRQNYNYVCSEPPLGTTWKSLQRDLTETPVGEVCLYDPGLYMRNGANYAFNGQSKPGIVFPDDVKVSFATAEMSAADGEGVRADNNITPLPRLSSLDFPLRCRAWQRRQHSTGRSLAFSMQTNSTSQPLTRRLPEFDPKRVNVDLSRGVFDALSRNCDQPIT